MTMNGLKPEAQKIANEIAKELGYKSYDDEWGREHLVDGPHGNCFFSATDLDLFLMQVGTRLKAKHQADALATIGTARRQKGR